MSNSILYYPTIEFQKSDYKWLWSASLLWDKIYRIVPSGYELHEPDNIRILCESGDIGKPLSPATYANAASDEFALFMDDYSQCAAALNGIDDVHYKYPTRVHHTKIDQKLKEQLLYDGKIFEADDDWILFDPHIANFYMTFLAKHIAEQNSLALYTHSRELWTTSTYYLCDGSLQADCFINEHCFEPSAEALVSLMITDVFPDGVLNVHPEQILRFREKRKDERENFINVINDFRNKLSCATAPEILKEIIEDEKIKIEHAKSDYKRSMDILKIVKFGGILTTLLTLTADALGYLPYPQSAATIFESSSLGIGVLTGIAEKALNKHPANPYTYLANIKKSFSTSYQLPNEPFLSQFNYALYRDFEEFIND